MMRTRDLEMVKRYFESIGFKISGLKPEMAVDAFQECVSQLSEEEKKTIPEHINKKLVELKIDFSVKKVEEKKVEGSQKETKKKKAQKLEKEKKVESAHYTRAQSFVDSMKDGLTLAEWERASGECYAENNHRKFVEDELNVIKRWSSYVVSSLIACGWVRKENNQYYKNA